MRDDSRGERTETWEILFYTRPLYTLFFSTHLISFAFSFLFLIDFPPYIFAFPGMHAGWTAPTTQSSTLVG